MRDTYLVPQGAMRKLRLAESLRTNVYVWGVTGLGKTMLVKKYLKSRRYIYISAIEPVWELEKLKDYPEGSDEYNVIVIDDLQFFREQEREKDLLSILDRPDCWVIMISRSNVPGWLCAARTRENLVMIGELDLIMSEKDIMKLGNRFGRTITEEQARRIWSMDRGNPFAVTAVLINMNDEDLDAGISDLEQRICMYLDEVVISNWSSMLQDFIMRVSVVDEFTLSLAEAITGDDRAYACVEEARQMGSFLIQKDDVYSIRHVDAARRKARRTLGKHELNMCIYNAGHWYELHDRFLEALDCYERCGETKSIYTLLVRNARRNPGNGYYYELRKYYLALPVEDVEKKPVLMSALAMVCSILMDREKSEFWYEKLKDYAEHARSVSKREAYSELIYLDIALPHRGTGDLITLFKNLPKMIRSKGLSLSNLSLTNNEPSQMDGGKDFCDWSKHDIILAESLGSIVTGLLGSWGRGLIDNALGESFYEKGLDDHIVLNHLVRARNENEAGGMIEQAFVTVGLQARLSIMNGDVRNAFHLVESFLSRARREKADRLLANIAALRCRLDLYAGREAEVKKWLASSPDEAEDFCTLKRYEYLTKVLCYISEKRYLEADTLLIQLRSYAEYAHRTYLLIQTDLLEAVVYNRSGKAWKELFLRALHRAKEYHFRRVITEHGAAVLAMLSEVKKQFLSETKGEADWYRDLLKEASHMVEIYPNYLGSDNISFSEFSPQSLELLRLQAQGKTIEEISRILGVSLRTAKYRASENYSKLGAKGKTDAVQKASILRLI